MLGGLAPAPTAAPTCGFLSPPAPWARSQLTLQGTEQERSPQRPFYCWWPVLYRKAGPTFPAAVYNEHFLFCHVFSERRGNPGSIISLKK